MGHLQAPPPAPLSEDLDLSGEDPVASARGLGPGPPCVDDASLKELLALVRGHLEGGLERRASAALEDVLDFLRRLRHHGPES
jgi:hypothetical protein